MAVGLSRAVSFFVLILLHEVSGEVFSKDESHGTNKVSVDVIFLKPSVQYIEEENSLFKIFCYQSISKSLFQIWRSVHLVLEHVPLSYELFLGENETLVYAKYKEKSNWYPSSWFSEQNTIVDFPAFSSYCIGIATKEKYIIQLKVKTLNYWKLLQTVVGILLFLSAPSLSRNSFFHYTSGVSVGVIASVLILVFVISRFIPKKSASYLAMLFGYSFILYILKVVWRDINEIISSYTDILLAYCLLSAFVSFIVCYRLGPVKNVRTFNIIQWSMQALSLIAVFFSSEYREVSTATIIIVVCIRWIPTSWIAKCQCLWFRYFPPRLRLLTELEYIEQGHIETRKALEHLRQYCSSPECNAWKVASKLKDPIRFANFIEKGIHYTDQELLEYNAEDCSDDNTAESEIDNDEDLNVWSSNNRHCR